MIDWGFDPTPKGNSLYDWLNEVDEEEWESTVSSGCDELSVMEYWGC